MLKTPLAGAVFLGLILGLFLPCCSKQPLYENARISIEPDTADFGTIPKNDPIAFHYVSLKARNLGKEPLNISDIELPEGFDYTMLPRKSINGGETATLKISIDVRKFSGSVSETAHALSDDSTQPRMPIKLVATIAAELDAETFKVGDEPDISFDHKAVEFGVLSRNQMVEHTFPFKNLGKRTLVIHDIEIRCICATATPTIWEIPPGGSAAIVVKFEAYKYPGKTPLKSVVIMTNDPDEPNVSLGVSATIVDAVFLEPEVVLLPNVQSGQPASAEVKLIQGGNKELLIEKTETSSPNVSVISSPIEGDQKGYLLKVTVAPDTPQGKFDETITIFTNYGDFSREKTGAEAGAELYKNYSRLELPVKGSVTGAISVTPQTINFGSGTPGQPLQRKLLVSSMTSRFDIESLSLTDPDLRVSHSPLEAGKKYEITVEFLPGQAERSIEDELVITTTSAKLVVPIFAAVKSRP